MEKKTSRFFNHFSNLGLPYPLHTTNPNLYHSISSSNRTRHLSLNPILPQLPALLGPINHMAADTKTVSPTTKSEPLPTLVKEKEPLAFFDFWFAFWIGIFFITSGLVDLSVVDFNQPAFTAQYIIWKSQAPYVKLLATVISFTVPLALVTNVIGFVTIFLQKASFTRHICDFLNLAALLSVIANGIMIKSAEAPVLAAALAGDLDSFATHLPALRLGFLINLGLNLSMAVIHVVRYASQVSAVAALAQEGPVKSKKD